MGAFRGFWEGEEGNSQGTCLSPSFTSRGPESDPPSAAWDRFTAYADMAGPETARTRAGGWKGSVRIFREGVKPI